MKKSNYKVTYWNKLFFIDTFLKKLLKYNREKIHKIFLKNTDYNDSISLLDLGTTSASNDEHNIILQKTINNKNITCLSDQDLTTSIRNKYPHIKNFIKGDGKNTNLKDDLFEIVYSSATLEHVGSYKDQIQFVKECYRLAKKSVFITTPNRFYPIDFHTKLPFFHWLPKKLHRIILKFIGLEFYSLEKNLNLLCKNDLENITKILNIKNYKILNHRFIFFTSNLILLLKKY